MFEEHQVNLFARYEQRLLSGASTKQRVIPAVIVTGFLGSGKTTLVQHVLRNRGSLRIAVLVNEVGQIDVDSELVNAKQGNAALGLTAADLSGGCVCCSRADDLVLALQRIREPTAATAAGAGPAAGGHAGGAASSGPCDYLLVETSGAADAGPLAEALLAGGFRLDAVVAVVDAEAGREALKHPVARAQVECADVVVLNKCDLVMGPAPPPGPGAGAGVRPAPRGLGALADLEDSLAEMAPGVRVVRARFGEVPLTAVLDVEPVSPAQAAAPVAGATASGGATAAGGGVSEAAGFMSHEAVPVGGGAGGYRLATGPLTAGGLTIGSSRHAARRGTNPAGAPRGATAPAPPASSLQGQDHYQHDHHDHHRHHHQHCHPYPGAAGTDAAAAAPGPGSASASTSAHHTHVHPHAHAHAQLHSGFHTESVVAAEGPCSLVAFADFVVRNLVREPALLRSKGFMWFTERRSHRFTFHLSGRRRVEAAQEGPWEGPPATQLVFIGTDADAMRRLRDLFVTEVLLPPPQPPAMASAAAAAAAAAGAAAAQPSNVSSPQPGADAAAAADVGQGFTGRAANEDGRCTSTCVPGACEAAVSAGAAQGGSAPLPSSPADAAAAEIVVNERLQVLDAGPWKPAAAAVTGAGAGSGCRSIGERARAEENAESGHVGSAGPQPVGPVPMDVETVARGSGDASGGNTGGDRGGDRGGGGGGVEGGDGGGGVGGGGWRVARLVNLTARGSVLHGINGEELNAELMRRGNGTGRMLLVGVTAPGKISAVTNVQSRERVLSLLLPLAADPAEAQAQSRSLLEAAEPLLRKAYAHVHNCKCDVAGAMQQQ